jgi:uncharacterized damage-inducible protein DinB
MMTMSPPANPAGSFVPVPNPTADDRSEWIAQIALAPDALRQAVKGLSEDQLDTHYKNWSIRQIVHHLADSHVHSYIRFKWALTEDQPTIKPYDEGRCAALEDSLSGDVEPALALYAAIHARWVQLLRIMSSEEFSRSFVHPETGRTVRLDEALCYYAWHCRHHTGQITWLREQHGW